MKIYCCECDQKVTAELTDGHEIYPRRKDLSDLPFWVCRECGNYVGCHRRWSDSKKPLGCIPTPEIRKARGRIHAVIDPLWKTNKISRTELYRLISAEMGCVYHTANIRSMDEARRVFLFVTKLSDKLNG